MQILINIYINFTLYHSYNRDPNTDFLSYNLKDKIPLAFVEIRLFTEKNDFHAFFSARTAFSRGAWTNSPWSSSVEVMGYDGLSGAVPCSELAL